MAAVRNAVAITVLAGALIVASSSAAVADVSGQGTGDGERLTLRELRELQQIQRDAKVAREAANAKAAKLFEYASVADCGSNNPESAVADDFCLEAVAACEGNTPEQGLGPAVRLFRREVDAAGVPKGPWQEYGITCFPRQAPGAPERPALTMEMVVQAFHDTKFAKPTVEIQPKGNVTLVTLPTYFQLVWPEAGFQPEEVDRPDPTALAGFRVEIRPRLKSVNYVYGDGTSSGPTQSLGGPYPEGDVVKEYDRAGTYQVRADVTYGGQFRVDGGAWIDIPGQVVIRGTSEPLQVRTAHARLVSH